MNQLERKLINMHELLSCLTNAGNLIRPELANHHQQVAYLASEIGTKLNLSKEQKKNLLFAGLMHDVGALSFNEKLELIENEPPSIHSHAFKGAQLIEDFVPLREVADIIRYHHLPWNDGEGQFYMGNEVPLLSHIIHLADRIVVSIDQRYEVLGQTETIRNKVSAQSNKKFIPELVDAFLNLSKQEYIWLDIVYMPSHKNLQNIMMTEPMELDLDEVIELAKVFANIIDYRSPFTANHSVGVAKTAEKLAELAGFSESECKRMLVAGYLHDFGKLAIENDILEKHSSLNVNEFNAIKSHTFYTYRLLQTIKEFETINEWASFHHEKLNGKGYPFHLKASNISIGSRIMAVADIFTAITEDRPYRKAMPYESVVKVLRDMVADGSISDSIVTILLKNYDFINEQRKQAQHESNIAYQAFIKEM